MMGKLCIGGEVNEQRNRSVKAAGNSWYKNLDAEESILTEAFQVLSCQAYLSGLSANQQ